MADERWGPVDVEFITLAAEPRERSARRPPSGRRLVLLAVLAAAALVVVGLAVLRHDGTPHARATYPVGTPVAADAARYGTTVRGSVALLVDDVADPDGGPRWGLRTFATTRGYGCLQVGRVQDGRLGVLALSGSVGSSVQPGRFHALPAAAAAQATTCVPQDGAGAAFVATHAILTTAATPAPCWYDSAGATRLFCPARTTRTVDAGLLGPRATAVTARIDGHRRRLPTRGRQGAYLVVQRPVRPSTLPQTLAGRTYALPNEAPLAQTPASNVIAAVAYAGAPPCVTRPTLSPRGSCASLTGFTPIPQPGRGAARTAVTVQPRHGGVTVFFAAPLPARPGLSDFRAFITGPHRTRTEVPLATDATAQTWIAHRIALAPGRYRVDVRYRVRPPFPRTNGGLDSPGYPVGRATVRVPAG